MSATNANFIIESYVCDSHVYTYKKTIMVLPWYIDHGNTMVLSLTFSSETNPVHNTMLSKFKICLSYVHA